MLPYKTAIKLDRESPSPLYMQLANQIICQIMNGTLGPGTRLPGTRQLSKMLDLNRRTVLSALEELEAQGWLKVKAKQGTYVCDRLPKFSPRDLPRGVQLEKLAPFTWEKKFDFLEFYDPPPASKDLLVIDAGYPDLSLAPSVEWTRSLSSIARNPSRKKLLSYSDQYCGDIKLRRALVAHLQETRGLQVRVENVMVTRGSLMAFSLIFKVILQQGDQVAVGKPGFQVGNNIIKLAGGETMDIPVDQDGMKVEVLEAKCKSKPPKAVFIMPHHHNPTTVTLSPERRMHLLQLAQVHGFAIIEDDYDYDFHYTHSPVMPMATSDGLGRVIYVGSLSKSVAPGLRTGYIVAQEALIQDLARISRFYDCHGNLAQERAIADLYEVGEIRRHLRKALLKYKDRRDFFCRGLKDRFGDRVKFQVPAGGLAAWVHFNSALPLNALRDRAFLRGVQITKPVHQDIEGLPIQAIRMGFASLSKTEMSTALDRLLQAWQDLDQDNFS